MQDSYERLQWSVAVATLNNCHFVYVCEWLCTAAGNTNTWASASSLSLHMGIRRAPPHILILVAW